MFHDQLALSGGKLSDNMGVNLKERDYDEVYGNKPKMENIVFNGKTKSE